MAATLLNAIHLVWTFDLAQGSEKQDIAEFGLWFQYGPGGSAPQTDLDFLAQNGADAWQANVSGVHYASNVSLRNVTARIFTADGKTLRLAEKAPATAWNGTASAPALPWETSLCISLYGYNPGSFASNARQKRGRYYLPPMASEILEGGNSGFMQDALLEPILAEQNDFYGHLYAGAFPGTLVVIPVVYSRVAEDFTPVQYLVADAKIDSQRRRENRELARRAKVAIS